jgi:hypothetical protein
LAGGDDLVLLAVVVPPMILVEACFGVVLEAPFGAIPFFWFLGILLVRPVRRREPPVATEWPRPPGISYPAGPRLAVTSRTA